MQNSTYSTTQSTNLTAIVGVLVLVLNQFNVNIGSEELTLVLGAALSIGGVLMNWWNRYQKGDLTLGGFRK